MHPLHGKFMEHGITKYIPDPAALEEAYRRAAVLKPIQEKIDELEETMMEETEDPPDNLDELVKEHLKEHPNDSWDEAIWEIQDTD